VSFVKNKKVKAKAKFGWIKINGDKFTKDVVIHSNGKVTKRKKKLSKDLKANYGHTPLSEKELDFLDNEKFEAIYVGTGHDFALPVTPQALDILKKHNATIASTPEVVEKIGQEQNPFVAIIHITC
jgi:hypothetical protein